MDLGTMARKLRAGTYRTAAEFASDIELIAHNAALYNGSDSPFAIMAATLRGTAMRLIAELPKQEAEPEPPQTAVSPPPASAAPLPPVVVKQAVTPIAPAPAAAIADPSCQAPPPPPAPASAEAHEVRKRPRKEEEATLPPEAEEDWRDCLTHTGGSQVASHAPLLPPLPRDAGACFWAPPSPPHVPLFADDCDAAAAMRDALTPLLRRTGFDAAHSSAADTLAGVAVAHVLRLGAALRRHADKHATTATSGNAPAVRARHTAQRVPTRLVQQCIADATGTPWTALRDALGGGAAATRMDES